MGLAQSHGNTSMVTACIRMPCPLPLTLLQYVSNCCPAMDQLCHSGYRAGSRCAPSQWEMALLCNDISHWLGASLESALRCHWSLGKGSAARKRHPVGPVSTIKPCFPGMWISIIKIRQSWDCLTFMMWIPTLLRWHLYNEMALVTIGGKGLKTTTGVES